MARRGNNGGEQAIGAVGNDWGKEGVGNRDVGSARGASGEEGSGDNKGGRASGLDRLNKGGRRGGSQLDVDVGLDTERLGSVLFGAANNLDGASNLGGSGSIGELGSLELGNETLAGDTGNRQELLRRDDNGGGASVQNVDHIGVTCRDVDNV